MGMFTLEGDVAEPITEFGDVKQLEQTAYSASDEIYASFRLNSSLGTLDLALAGRENFSPQPGFNPFKLMEIDGLLPQAEILWQAESPEEYHFLANRVREEEWAATVQEGTNVWSRLGVDTFFLLTDPVMLTMESIVAAKLAAKGLGRVAQFAGATGAGEATAAMVRHQTQLGREWSEDFVNIAGATVLGGIMGKGVSLLEGPRRELLGKKMKGYMAAGTTEDVPLPGDELLMAIPGQSVGSAGLTTLKDIPKGGAKLARLGPLATRLPISPNTRLAGNVSDTVNLMQVNLTEDALVRRANLSGISVVEEGGSVETRVKQTRADSYRYTSGVEQAYKDYKIRVNKEGTAAPLPKDAFFDLVGHAARNDDSFPAIPEIGTISKKNRREIMDPMKKRQQSVGLLPEDLTLKGSAKSHYPRVYDRNVTIPQARALRKLGEEWYEKILRGQMTKAKDAKKPDEDVVRNLREALLPAAVKRAVASMVDSINHGGFAAEDAIRAGIKGTSGFFKERGFPVPDNVLSSHGFLVNDPRQVVPAYIREVMPDTILNEHPQFKTHKFSEVATKIVDDFNEHEATYRRDIQKNSFKTLTEKQVTEQFEKQKAGALQDMEALWQLIRGRYMLPDNPNDGWFRTAKFMGDFNYVEMMGQVVVSSYSDVAMPAIRFGLARYAKALVQMGSTIGPALKNAKQFQKFVLAVETNQNMAMRNMFDLTEGLDGRRTIVERGMEKLRKALPVLNMHGPWNDFWRGTTSLLAADEILELAIKAKRGTLKHPNRIRLATDYHLTDDTLIKIADQFEAHGETIKGFRYANPDDWDDGPLVGIMSRAVGAEVDATIISAGKGEKPLVLQRGLGKIYGQFQTHAWSSTQKLLLRGLQMRDAKVAGGVMLAVWAGMVSLEHKAFLSGKPPPKDPQIYLAQAINQSGVVGILGTSRDIGSLVENPNTIPRFLLGATGANLSRTGDALVNAVDGDITNADVEKLIKLEPIHKTQWLARTLYKAYSEDNP